MEKPLVSVVLCTYNGAAFLAEQVESILRQDYRPLELIISDDASTDGTRDILARYSNNPLVNIFYNEDNTGLTANFDFAARQAKGQLIAFSDQDDVWVDNKIQRLVDARGDHPLVYSDSLLVDEAGLSMEKKLSDLKKMYSGADSRGYILYSCVWGHGMLISRKLLDQSLPLPTGVHHDIWITFQAFLNGGIIYHDEVLTMYRQHRASTSQTLPEKDSKRVKKSKTDAYAEKLAWIRLMQEHERPAYQVFYKKLVSLYGEKANGHYVFPLLPFMLQYRKEIFRFSKKGFFSQFVEIIKQARSVSITAEKS